jgi:hypothetical protein
LVRCDVFLLATTQGFIHLLQNIGLTVTCHRAIVHCPFPPFSILLTHAIQLMDTSDIDYLEGFAASLEPSGSAVKSDSITQPHHIYSILCKAARLYLEFNSGRMDSDLFGLGSDTFPGVDHVGQGLSRTGAAAPPEFQHEEGWLGEWFYGNQLIMSVLDEDAFFREWTLHL